MDTTDPVRAQVEQCIACLVPDRSVQVRWVPDSTTTAAQVDRHGQARIELGTDLLGDRDQALFFAAHEVAHLRLGHLTRRYRWTNTALLLTVLVLVLAAIGFAAQAHPPALGFAPLAAMLTLHLFIRLRMRPNEYAADDFAAWAGHSIEHIEPPIRWHWWHELMPTHPAWRRRQQRQARRATVRTATVNYMPKRG